jgi:hypothetical protein
MCNHISSNPLENMAYKAWTITHYCFPFYDMMVLVVILYIKGHTDALQGVNKLDNLLKVSKYQKYKTKQKMLGDSIIDTEGTTGT